MPFRPRSPAARAALRGRRARVTGKSDAFTAVRAIPDTGPLRANPRAIPNGRALRAAAHAVLPTLRLARGCRALRPVAARQPRAL